MIKKLFLFTVILLSACATSPVKKQDTSLYATYSNYAKNFKNKTTFSNTEANKIFTYLSPRYQDYLLSGRERSHKVLTSLITKYLDLPNYYVTEASHLAKHEKNSSCLSINAWKENQKRVALYIRYIKNNTWLIDNVIVEYLSENEEFLKEPICDSWKLQQKRMEAWSQ